VVLFITVVGELAVNSYRVWCVWQ